MASSFPLCRRAQHPTTQLVHPTPFFYSLYKQISFWSESHQHFSDLTSFVIHPILYELALHCDFQRRILIVYSLLKFLWCLCCQERLKDGSLFHVEHECCPERGWVSSHPPLGGAAQTRSRARTSFLGGVGIPSCKIFSAGGAQLGCFRQAEPL
jgi:hypothetical protein